MRSVAERYLNVAVMADPFSKLAALVIVVIAIVELVGVGQAVRTAENASHEAIRLALITPIIYLVAFGSRLFWLFLGTGLIGRVLTWWIAVAAIYLDVQLTGGPASGAMYSLFDSFPLLVSGMTFTAIGAVKFVVTMLFVLITRFQDSK
jgi:hypothetical protein